MDQAAAATVLANRDAYLSATNPEGNAMTKLYDIAILCTKAWRLIVPCLMTLMLSQTGFSQTAENSSRDQMVRFSETSSIRSADGGITWQIAEGQLEDIPYWAQNWLTNDQKGRSDCWKPNSVTVELASGAVIRRESGADEWKSTSADRYSIPNWARRWLNDEPVAMPTEFPQTPVQSLCTGEKPLQRTQTLQVGPDLAIRSFDGGRTWVMAQGMREDLPDWAEAWLNQPVVEVLPAKELAYGKALIRSVDGGKTWTLVKGEMADLPDWVRPWLGDEYPTVNQPAPAREAESGLPHGFELFPNPSRNYVTLRFHLKKAQTVQVLLYDLQGRLVREVQSEKMAPGNQEVNFSVSDLAAAAYFLQFNAEDRQERIRLVKNR